MSRPSIPMLGLCVAEWRKAKGRGLAPAILLFGAIHGVLGPGVLKGLEVLNEKTLGTEKDPFDFLAGAEAALQMAAFPVNGFALLLLAAIVWAEDFSLGTLAMVFVRPVARWRIFVAKVLVCWGFGLASILLAVIVGGVLGLFLFGTTFEVESLRGMMFAGWMADVGSMSERMLRVLAGVGAATLLLGPAFLLCALCANISRSPVLTLFLSLFILVADFFVFLVLKGWAAAKLDGGETAGKVAEWTLWAGRGLFSQHSAPEAWEGVPMLLAPTAIGCAVFGGLALLLWVRRDVT
jgi:ABC-2 type transport system permease protein